jgi:hypothetical protein
MESPFRQRRLSPQEIRRLTALAARLAETDPNTRTAEVTLSVDELVRAGAALGLPESAMTRAIASSAEDAPSAPTSAIATRLVVHEHELSGELPPDAHEAIVETIEEVAGTAGRVQAVGRKITWTPPAAAQPSLVILSRDGRTTLRVSEAVSGLPYLLVLPLGALPVMLVAVILTLALALSLQATHVAAGVLAAAVACLTLAASVALGRRLGARQVARREAFLAKMAQRLVDETTRAIPPTLPPKQRIAQASDSARTEDEAATLAGAIEDEDDADVPERLLVR